MRPFRRISTFAAARRIPEEEWRVVVPKGREATREEADLLLSYRGRIIRADTFLARLLEVFPGEKCARIAYDRSFEFFPLGSYYAIALPIRAPAEKKK